MSVSIFNCSILFFLSFCLTAEASPSPTVTTPHFLSSPAIIDWTDFMDMNLSSTLVKPAPMIVSLPPHWSSILPNCLLYVNDPFTTESLKLDYFINTQLECENGDFTCLGSYLEHNNKNKTTVTSDHFFLDELWGSSSNCPHGKDLVEFHEYLAREVLGVNRSMLVDASNYDILGDGGSDYVDIQSVVYYSILKQEPGLKSYYSLFGYDFLLDSEMMKQFYQEVVKGIDYLRTTPIYLILPQISPPFHHPRRQPAPRIQVHPSADHIQFLEMVDRISTHFNKINYNNNNTSTSTGYNFQTDETIASISRFVYLTPDFLGGKESRMFLRGLYSMSGHSLCDSCQLKTALNHASRALFMIKTTLE